MELTSIEKQFQDVAVVKGGVFLLRVNDAIRFVKQCGIEGVPIAGIEGFRMIRDKIQPLQEHSVDFEEARSKTHELLEKFLRERIHEDLWFEVVSVDRAQ